MKITVNIETNEPADLIRVANALAGVMPDPTAGSTDRPKPPRSPKPESPAAPAATTPPLVSTGAPAPEETAAASPSEPQVVVTEADLVAAANGAAAKLGAGGPSKVKEWIAKDFTCDDGSAGKLKMVRADQRPALLAGLQQIAQGVKVV